jgi:hypothetical protein
LSFAELVPFRDGRLRLNTGSDPIYSQGRKDGHKRFILAADIGGTGSDPSALLLLQSERVPYLDENNNWQLRPVKRTVVWADIAQIALQADFVAHVCKMLTALQGKVYPSPIYVCHDATGMGAPVGEMLRAAKVRSTGIITTSGAAVTLDRKTGTARVAKSTMMEQVAIDVNNGSLQFAEDLPLLDELFEHVTSMTIKQTAAGNTVYESSAKGHHSDLMSALALALMCDREEIFAGVAGGARPISGLF